MVASEEARAVVFPAGREGGEKKMKDEQGAIVGRATPQIECSTFWTEDRFVKGG
jgi:hypothetical protein